MNPAFSIWAWAQGVCILACIAIGLSDPDAAGILIIIYLLVALASLVSLLCFFMLFEVLRLLKLSQFLAWSIIVPAVTLTVCFNSLCLISAIDGASHLTVSQLWDAFQDLLLITSIPLGASLFGLIMNVRRINNYTSAVQLSELQPESHKPENECHEN
jgi:hypothetical protein